jgi:folate-dependent phosphoribosylglycinamide formyltransferase PurN
MRIVFLAVDDEFAGSMQRHVFASHPDWIVGSVISTHPIYKKSHLGGTIFVLRRSGLLYGMEMFRMKVIRKLVQQDGIVTPTRLAQQHKVDVFRCANINDGPSVDRLISWRPDLVISTNFSHYIGANVRATARVGTWNLHKSLLPKYRGMAPNFYALLNGEREVGATLHKVAKGIDIGDILQQVKVPVISGDTVYTLNRKTADAGGRMLASFLDGIDLEHIVAVPQPQGEWPSYSYPTSSDVHTFRRRGFRF